MNIPDNPHHTRSDEHDGRLSAWLPFIVAVAIAAAVIALTFPSIPVIDANSPPEQAVREPMPNSIAP